MDDFLQYSATTIPLDGKVIEGVQVNGIQNNEKSEKPEVAWFAEMGGLDPGEHVVTYDVNWSKMIDNGIVTYGPCGKFETQHDECQIIVEYKEMLSSKINLRSSHPNTTNTDHKSDMLSVNNLYNCSNSY